MVKTQENSRIKASRTTQGRLKDISRTFQGHSKDIKPFDPYRGTKVKEWIVARHDVIRHLLIFALFATLVLGSYIVVMEAMFYEPPTVGNGLHITDKDSWFALCGGIFIITVGLGIMIHGIALVKVSR